MIKITKEEYNKNPNICLECGNPIFCNQNELVSQIRVKKFCNQSCAATYNNKNRKSKDVYKCTKCGEVIGVGKRFQKRLFCDSCNPNNTDWSKVTLSDVRAKRKYQPYSRIRGLAKKDYDKSSKPKHCMNCGYKKHYEICHIKAISDFDENTPISTINDLKNLMALCPNCHWEYDNHLLKLSDIIDSQYAGMTESADVTDSKSVAERRVSSSLTTSTIAG